MRFRRRASAAGVSVALVGGMFAAMVANAPPANADTTQNNGCLGVTGTFSQFAVPITGTSTPSVTGTLPGPVYPSVTLSGTSVSIAVDSTLIGAGVVSGLVSAADSLPDLGVTTNKLKPSQSAGIDAVSADPGAVTLKVAGSNTSQGTQTATNPGAASLTFYVTADALGGSVVVYSNVTNPPVLGGPNVVTARTGTVLVGSLVVNIPLGDTTWTPTGVSPIVFTEQNTAPANLTIPSTADELAAPLILDPFINGSIEVPFHCWPGTVTGTTTTSLVPGASSAIASTTVIAPLTPPTCATPQAASVGGGQSVNVTPSCTNINPPFSLAGSTVNITVPASHGTATVGAGNIISYANDGLGAGTDTFSYTVTNTVGPSNTVVVNIAVLNNQCTASPTCSLRQVLILPVLPSTLSMSEAALGGPGNPTFSTAILGGVVSGTSCNPGPITLNGQPQTACGALNPITVVNARGTDAKWDVTGQVTDFIDGTRGPTDTCSPPTANNIAQTPPNNHCIPGDNLGWVPMANITDPWVPGDTAAVNAGAVMLPSQPAAQTLVPFPPNILGARSNINGVTAPFGLPGFPTPAPGPGMHDLAQELCGAPANQSGGTFRCDAGLLLAVPGSAAAAFTPGYTATLTLTLG